MCLRRTRSYAVGLLAASTLFQFAFNAGVGCGNTAFGGKVAQDDGTLSNRYPSVHFVCVLRRI